MSQIAINVTKLPLSEKLLKGQSIISMSTTNPNVPGNADALAAFAQAQTTLTAAINLEIDTREAVPAAKTARQTALEDWMDKLTTLAAFTESATLGDAEKIESAGFAVRATRTPPQPLPAPEGVVARLNGKPGHTHLSWPPLPGAKSYILEMSLDPTTPSSWKFVCSCTKSEVDVNGAQAGQLGWYRVAGVNAKGQGPWSAPVPRPVM